MSLNAFLTSPTEQTGEFRGRKSYRNHIRCFVPHGPDGVFKVDEDTSARSLIISKHHGQYEKAHKDWKENCDIFIKYLEGIVERVLMRLLGDFFWPIMAVDVNKVAKALKGESLTLKLADILVKDEGEKAQNPTPSSSAEKTKEYDSDEEDYGEHFRHL